jgi:hypothetical protein
MTSEKLRKNFGKTSGPRASFRPRVKFAQTFPQQNFWSAHCSFFAFVNRTMTNPGTRSDFANVDGWSNSNNYAALPPSPCDDDDAGSIVVPRRRVKKSTSFDHSFTLSRDFQTMVCTPVVAASTLLSGQPHCLTSFPGIYRTWSRRPKAPAEKATASRT